MSLNEVVKSLLSLEKPNRFFYPLKNHQPYPICSYESSLLVKAFTKGLATGPFFSVFRLLIRIPETGSVFKSNTHYS
jgi:hypothetical protein